MKRLLLRLLVVALSSAVPVLRAAETAAAPAPAAAPTPGVDDPGKLLPANPPAGKALAEKLAGFERTTGMRMLLRFQPKSPTTDEDKVPGAYMRALASRLGTAQRGALVVYFADEDDWRVWIGDVCTPAFAGRPGSAKELTESGAIHQAKETLLAAARAAGDATFAAARKSAPSDRPPSAAEHLRLQADALLDGLITRLAPH